MITGSNRGIGKTMLEGFAVRGASLIACTRGPSDSFSQHLESLVNKYGISVKQLYFDLKDEAQVKAIGSALIRDKYEIDVLINNAAIAAGGYFQMTSLGKIRELFDVNFFNQLLLTQSVAKNMMSRMRGSIINMASVAGLDPDLGFIGYGSSKAALIYATQVMAKEYAPYHIRVNAIAPGLTDTDMANQMEAKARERLIEASAVKRLITPEEVAGVAYYLAGDESADVNGQIFRVDGSK